MRLNEFASADDTLALWKLVSDSVWTAVSREAHQQAQQKAMQQRSPKPKRSQRIKAKRIPSPPPPTNKQVNKQLTKLPNALAKQPPSVKKVSPNPNAALRQPPTSNLAPTQLQKTGASTQPTPTHSLQSEPNVQQFQPTPMLPLQAKQSLYQKQRQQI